MKHLLFLTLLALSACNSSNTSNPQSKSYDHSLNIPSEGITAKMGANTQKIIEGDKTSLIIAAGDINKKEADISIRLGDKVLVEKLVAENQSIRFNYFDHPYHLHVEEIKKPLIGSGKVSFTIK
jgi:hypothetical protein